MFNYNESKNLIDSIVALRLLIRDVQNKHDTRYEMIKGEELKQIKNGLRILTEISERDENDAS